MIHIRHILKTSILDEVNQVSNSALVGTEGVFSNTMKEAPLEILVTVTNDIRYVETRAVQCQ